MQEAQTSDEDEACTWFDTRAGSQDLHEDEARTYTYIEITLTEGRNRQVRRMVEALGARVLKLVRVKVGPIAIGTLPIGKWRLLTPTEIAALKSGQPVVPPGP